MRQITKTMYACSICGTEFEIEDECREHEETEHKEYLSGEFKMDLEKGAPYITFDTSEAPIDPPVAGLLGTTLTTYGTDTYMTPAGATRLQKRLLDKAREYIEQKRDMFAHALEILNAATDSRSIALQQKHSKLVFDPLEDDLLI